MQIKLSVNILTRSSILVTIVTNKILTNKEDEEVEEEWEEEEEEEDFQAFYITLVMPLYCSFA